ncbi:MAG: hypothetical protein HY905_02315 [Deltaproteobacteria bacterium]|nr:hypothetical protein [Deltaproteobacteria bacterium]
MVAAGKTNRRKERVRATIPPEVRAEILRRLEPEQERYLQSGAAVSFDFQFRGGYLYLAARRRVGLFGSKISLGPLARLGYKGDLEKWDFAIWRYSTGAYDMAQEFPFGEGTPEECFAVAADFYLWEYDALSAGSSVGTRPATRPAGQPFGLAWLLPRQVGGQVARPDLPVDVSAQGRGHRRRPLGLLDAGRCVPARLADHRQPPRPAGWPMGRPRNARTHRLACSTSRPAIGGPG